MGMKYINAIEGTKSGKIEPLTMALPPGQDVQAMFVVALFYGLYLSTLFHCLRWLIFTDEGWKIRKKISWTLLTVTVTLWALSTISKALQLLNTIHIASDANQKPTDTPQGSIGSTTTLPWMAVVIVSCNTSIDLFDLTTREHQ